MTRCLVSARETALHISASPIVRNIGELCFAFYTPEGDSVAVSTGIITHVHTMSEAIKFMIRQGYEDDPGISEGDIFCNNDPDLGNVHTTDVHTMIPIFWEGQMLGWAGGVAHQVDIGASTPGHDPVATANRFEDGFYVTAEKIGEHHEVRKDFKIRAQRSVRTPLYWDLDEKCRIAGIYMVRDAVYRIIREEGLEYFQTFMREAVEEGRQIFMARIRERLVPGIYRTASFMDAPYKGKAWHPEQNHDFMMHAPMTITIGPDGSFALDMDGASGPGPFPFNASEGSMQGALWVQITQTLIYDGKVNDGSYLAAQHHFPQGSWCNPGNSLLAYGTPWAYLIPAFTGMFRLLSRGYFSRGYREEIVSGYGFTGDPTQGGGVLANGTYFPVSNFELCAVGLGARGTMDGLDAAYAMWNPEADMGDAEVWETIESGLLYLSRRFKPDTAGYGRFRGGSGWESLRLVHGVQELQLYSWREGRVFHGGAGLFGGYPGATGYRLFVKDTKFYDMVADRLPYPLGDRNPAQRELDNGLGGTMHLSRDGLILPQPFQNGDVWLSLFSGGPGYGDPLERPIDEVARDVEGDIYLPETAKSVFGVIIDEEPDGVKADPVRTEQYRAALIADRRARSVSYQEFWQEERTKVSQGNLAEPVRRMYRESMQLSPAWSAEFCRFWNLPVDFQFQP
ncbi:MAG: acetone carboxylase subunit alpha [Sulfobacillus benefaciens]|uniref:Acetone carboxylase subunit alpha n=1 Tax=Sulfobacillus benefaciens TaxID=453960 RepID=A0A2T2X8L2_9FIRM|nr:MAG: acetone carboxylase subunit alpha [Sulfobacillus benefaciens]